LYSCPLPDGGCSDDHVLCRQFGVTSK
jgi:hypothetical protein